MAFRAWPPCGNSTGLRRRREQRRGLGGDDLHVPLTRRLGVVCGRKLHHLAFSDHTRRPRQNIEHHQVLSGTAGSMAPGFETEEALTRSKQAPDYWARKRAKSQTQAAE